MTFKLIYKSFEIQLDNNLNVTFRHILSHSVDIFNVTFNSVDF